MENTPNTRAVATLMLLLSENSEINFFEDDIYDQESLEKEGIPARESILLMWLAAALAKDGSRPVDVFELGTTSYNGTSPYSDCGPNWFNFPVKVCLNICFDILDAIKMWLKDDRNMSLFNLYFDTAKDLCLTTEIVELVEDITLP